MFLFIPLASGQSIAQIIYGNLSRQRVPLDIVPCVTMGNVYGPKSLESEIAGRNLIKKILIDRNCKDEFCGMQDRDILHLDDDNFKRCIIFMNKNKNIQCVTMPFIDGVNIAHIRMTALVLRTVFLLNYIWHFEGNGHLCTILKKDLGDRYCYYPSDKAMVQEVKL